MSDSVTEKTILLTGGAGFIGSNLVAGHNHVLTVDKIIYAGNALSLVDLPESKDELLVADITDASAIKIKFHRFRPQAVMHLAAESHVNRSLDGPGEFMSKAAKTQRLNGVLDSSKASWSQTI